MDLFLAEVGMLWWIGPIVIGAGTIGFFGLRGHRAAKARSLAYDASREALRTARHDAAGARHAVRIARAELGRTLAERAAGRADGGDVAAARRALDAAQRDTKAASATLRVHRANVTADRADLRVRDAAQLPLARLMSADDAVTARWMEYETDAARLIAFPAMSDARVPTTATFLAELRTTRALRPASSDARITPAQFGAYREGVSRLARAFDAAEAEAWRLARAAGSAPAGPGPDTVHPAAWVLSAQEIAQNLTQTVLARGAEALARATAPREAPRSTPTQDASNTSPRDAPAPGSRPTAPPTDSPVWPVPSRSPRPSPESGR